jgi:hypothetical protein
MTAPHPEAATTGAVTGEPAGSLDPHYFTPMLTCPQEAREQCESSCTTTSGILDLFCYESCVDDIKYVC